MKKNLPCYCHNHGSASRGSIVILTLWAIVFLAILASAVGGRVAADMRVAGRVKWIVQGSAIAGRAFEDALSVIMKDETEGYDTLTEPWADNEHRFKNVSYGGARYSLLTDTGYGLTDEERKININRAPADVLSRLFQITGGMSPMPAQKMALYLVDWRDANTTEEGSKEEKKEECQSRPPPYKCKDADFEALEELWWLPGMTAEVFDKIRGELTLYGIGYVNINTAGVNVLRCLGLSSGVAEEIVSMRKNNPFKETSQIAGNLEKSGLTAEDKEHLQTAVSSGLLGVRSDVYEGRIEVDFGGRHRKNFSFVVNRNGESKSWREW